MGLLQLDATRYWNGTHLSIKYRIMGELLSPSNMRMLGFCLHIRASDGLVLTSFNKLASCASFRIEGG
jgi:hypothetical protein